MLPDRYSLLESDASLRSELLDVTGVGAVEFLRSIDSTQRRARELAAEEAPDWTIVVADHQTAGRGQHGRTWSAASGASVMFSLVVRPPSPEAMALLPIRTGIAIAETLDAIIAGENGGLRFLLKWPNDVMTKEGKVAGVLCEGQLRENDLRAIVGIGINVHPFTLDPDVVARPAFLDEIAARLIDRFEVLREVVACVRRALDVTAPTLDADELARYASRNTLAGSTISEPVAGTVEGIDERGHLRVRRGDGRVESVV